MRNFSRDERGKLPRSLWRFHFFRGVTARLQLHFPALMTSEIDCARHLKHQSITADINVPRSMLSLLCENESEDNKIRTRHPGLQNYNGTRKQII